ncbi:MAG: type I restriction endonuclease subunit R, partial [Gammaproteobacteria bacterium]|nr:type I restriction endonuclease subunit R [Gammaproteobacteria bacterium]
SHYRLSKIRQQDIKLKEDENNPLTPGEGIGTAEPRPPAYDFLSHIISQLNEIFMLENLTEQDLVSYAYTIRDKLRENKVVMEQIANNTPEQAMLGDFPKAIDDAVMESGDAHQNLMTQLLSDPQKAAKFAKVVFELLMKKA